jgi:hypothetical protein
MLVMLIAPVREMIAAGNAAGVSRSEGLHERIAMCKDGKAQL